MCRQLSSNVSFSVGAGSSAAEAAAGAGVSGTVGTLSLVFPSLSCQSQRDQCHFRHFPLPTYHLRSVTMELKLVRLFETMIPFFHHLSHHHHAFGGCCGLSYKQIKTKAEQFQDQVLVIRRCCRNFNKWDGTLFCFVALGLVLLGDISLSSSNILYNYNSSTTLLMQFYKIRFE